MPTVAGDFSEMQATLKRVAETPRIFRRPVRLRARRETLELWRDVTMLNRAVLAEHARFIAGIRSSLVEEAARLVSAGGRTTDSLRLQHSAFSLGHARRLAEIFAAAEVAGRMRTRRQAAERAGDVALQVSGVRGQDSAFAEVFPANIPPTKVVEYIRSLPAVVHSKWEAFVAQHQRQGFTVTGIESERTLKGLRDLIAESVEKGWSIPEFESRANTMFDGLSQIGGGHLRTVWNMTVSNALRDGQANELRDPEIAAVLTHFLFDAIIDGVVRENHAALDNHIAPTDWPGWATYGDPLGFNCRCWRHPIARGRARRMIASGEGVDLVTMGAPAGAGPDPGFRQR